MSWSAHHSDSERSAAAAESALRAGDATGARELYRAAAEAEVRALDALSPDEHQTLGVTAVSAVALWYKARDYGAAAQLARRWLADPSLPRFAVDQLNELLRAVSSSARMAPELLAIINPDPVAAEAYLRKVHGDLTRWLEWRGCHDAEEVAGEAVYRALKKVAGGVDVSQSGLRAYIFGVGKLVAKELSKTKHKAQQLAHSSWDARASTHQEQQGIEARIMLADIRRLLSEADWITLLRYCTESDHTAQSKAMGVSPGYLRVIIHRIREQLKVKALPAREQNRDRPVRHGRLEPRPTKDE